MQPPKMTSLLILVFKLSLQLILKTFYLDTLQPVFLMLGQCPCLTCIEYNALHNHCRMHVYWSEETRRWYTAAVNTMIESG